MKRIRFLHRCVFETHGPNHPDNPVFEAEEVKELMDDQAERWLRRGKAELLEDLGPDQPAILADADPAKVDEMRAAIEGQFDTQTNDLSGQLDDASDGLKEAMKDQ